FLWFRVKGCCSSQRRITTCLRWLLVAGGSRPCLRAAASASAPCPSAGSILGLQPFGGEHYLEWYFSSSESWLDCWERCKRTSCSLVITLWLTRTGTFSKPLFGRSP